MKRSPESLWHYPRTDLAHKVLKSFTTGLIERFTLSAELGRGKTTFVQCDIAPLARKSGFLVVYVDFGGEQSSPVLAFANGVLTASKTQEGWLKRLVTQSPLNSLLENEFSTGLNSTPSGIEHKIIESAFNTLESSSKPILLILDEVQHLTSHADFGNFTAALRSFMTARTDGRINAIFTGSSQEGLNQLFQRVQAPFYQASSYLYFPDLGREFIEYELAVFQTVNQGIRLDIDPALEVFEAMDRSPGHFIELLQRMTAEHVYDFNKGVELLRLPQHS